MRKYVFFGLAILAIIVSAGIADSYAATSNSLTFNETYKEKLVCYKSEGYCDVVGSGKFTVSAKISLNGIDTTQFNSDTPIGISVESFNFNATLGDGGFVSPYKKQSAKFLVSDVDIDGITRQYLTVTLSWNKTSMTVKVTCITAPWDIEWPVIAYNYLGETSPISDSLSAEIDIDDLAVGFDLNATGSAKTKTTDKKDLGEYDTSTISVKASGTGTVID